jgi:hypothetical protein
LVLSEKFQAWHDEINQLKIFFVVSKSNLGLHPITIYKAVRQTKLQSICFDSVTTD